jgi:hypothetical protein
VRVKPIDLRKTSIGIDRTQAGGEGVVVAVSTDTKGDVYSVRLKRKRRDVTRMVRREHLVVHREK